MMMQVHTAIRQPDRYTFTILCDALPGLRKCDMSSNAITRWDCLKQLRSEHMLPMLMTRMIHDS